MDINVLFISGGKSCYHNVGLKVWYSELAKENFAMMGDITLAKCTKNWIAIYWLIVA